MDEQDYKSIILYYGREKYFNSMQNKSIEALTKFQANPCFRIYNGFALVLGNRIQEGEPLIFYLNIFFSSHLLLQVYGN